MNRHRSKARQQSVAQPVWLRMWALLCLLLTLGMGTAQAVHIHGTLLPAAAVQAADHAEGAPGMGADLCPLCTSAHQVALPSVGTPVWLIAGSYTAETAEASAVRPLRRWDFERFSRPPPELL